ncbi:LPS-assembly protein LptD [Borreliella lusitaniae]|uniref:LPS-assembly protein LptD n=1 Tax=Borreliella lusitaniae TaxID=100177 RepID=UPI002647E3C8|nr:LPS-assembly protein LptD [Borreliella lusitaniae]WKC85722.1 LPS-assembly protein LptD [Borreliella lusitaniae]
MREFLYRNVFKKSFVILLIFLPFSNLIFAQGAQGINDENSKKIDKLTLSQKSYLRELELSTDEDLKKWALKEGLKETDVLKIRELLLKKFGIDPELFVKGKGLVGSGRYKIIIETTDNLENFTYGLTEDESIVFEGRVSILVEDTKENKKHNIKGDRIVLNKSSKKLYSIGNVEYILDMDTNEKLYFYGNEFFVDFDSQNFLLKDGILQKKMQKNQIDHILSFGGKVLKKIDNDVTILEQAFATTSKIPEPYYSIKASKIWVLPSGDFGFLNAVFYMGRVPVFYIPFFFRPGDSLFFNPSLVLNPRKGFSVFNTIYFFGNKSSGEDSSFLDFDFNSVYNSGKKPYIRNGYLTYFFAENSASNFNKDYVKLIFDIYANLGFYAGIDFDLSNTLGRFKTLEGNFGLGFTRNVYSYDGGYYPFDNRALKQSLFSFSNLNKGDIFGFEVPFRYLLKFKTEFLLSDALFSVLLEHYSDPYVNIDFKDRIESATFFSLLNLDQDSVKEPTRITAFDWNLSSFYSRTFYDGSILDYKLNNLGLSFKLSDYDNLYVKSPLEKPKEINDPTRKWFYLERIYVPYIDLNFQKDLYNNQWTISADPKEMIMSPEVKNLENKDNDKKSATGKEKETEKIKDLNKNLYISPEPITLKSVDQFDSFFIRFGINPYLRNNVFFNNSGITSPKDFNYEIKNYLFDIKNKTDIKIHADFYNRLITFENLLYLNTVEYNPLNKDFKLEDKDKKSEHSLINQINLNLLPFIRYPLFSRSILKFENKSTLYSFNKKYDTDLKSLVNKNSSIFFSDPETFYQSLTASLIYDYNYFNAELSGELKNSFEDIKASSELKLSLDFPYLLQEAGIGIKYYKKFKEDAMKNPGISVAQSLLNPLEPQKPSSPYKNLEMSPALYYKIEPKYLNYFKFSFLAAYDPLINRVSELSFKLNVFDFQVLFAMKDDFEYNYDTLKGDFSKVGTTTKLVPYFLDSSYKKELNVLNLFDNKLSFTLGIDAGWRINLQKFTDNELRSALTFKFKYTEFFEIYFSTVSVNTKTFRYFKGYMDQIGLETVNIFTDLLKSFNFFNLQDRKNSLFKIKKFSSGFKFNFYDWKFVGEYNLEPDLLIGSDGAYSPIWRNNFTIYISWNFFAPIKASFENNKDTNYDLIINRKTKK